MKRELKRLSVALLAVLVASACNREPREAARVDTAATAAGARTDSMAGADTGKTAKAAPLDDPTIVAIFDAANSYDIETGELALQKSKNQTVRNLARQFVNDHKRLREQGRDLAKKLNVTPTPPAEFDLAKDHQKAMEDLRGKSGAEFDRDYLQHEVDFHQAVIDAVNEKLLPAIQNDRLKTFVQQTAPAFQAHLEAAKQAQKKLAAAA